MRKTILGACLAVLAACAACTTAHNAAASSLAGEWDIVEIEGSAVSAADCEEPPFLGFDAKGGNVYGSTGCNQLTGSLRADGRRGTVDFSALGCTRMLCADMRTEDRLLGAMGRVRTYALTGDSLSLADGSGRIVVRLRHRAR